MSNQEDEFKAKPYDFSRPVPPLDKDSVEPSVRSMLSSSHSGEIENSFPLNQKVDTLLASQAWFATLPPRSKPSDPKVVHAIASDRRGQAVDTVKKQRNSDWEQLAPKFKPLFKYDIFEDKAKVKNQLAKSIIKILEELSCIRRVQYFYQLLILIYVPLQGLLQTFDLNLLFLALELANMLVSALNNGCTRLLTRHSSLPLRKFLTKVNYRSLRFDLVSRIILSSLSHSCCCSFTSKSNRLSCIYFSLYSASVYSGSQNAKIPSKISKLLLDCELCTQSSHSPSSSIITPACSQSPATKPITMPSSLWFRPSPSTAPRRFSRTTLRLT